MKKVQLGDIYSISTKKGLGFLQFVKSPENDKSDVELVKVSYDLHTKIPDNIERFFLEDFFYVQFPVKAALKKGIIDFVKNIDLPRDFVTPRYFRTEHYLHRAEWLIIDKKTNEVEHLKSLTEEQLKFSPNSVWNDTYLKERLEEGWKLENWK
ncbi:MULTISPECIES: hypothetical protein [unclassified Chryseobacterium]|uniref:hypothetical protein n=1 Tax=unclassified Chryseobacterium TaxID=2593645 RepID=UPI0021E52F92|nr:MULTISPECIES: hypothetical protein [unclassified Chryseobacterium]MEA1851099.1 hypothetical protein [Chryseobacterium sp. MHB01]